MLTLEDIGSFLSKLAEKSESVYWLSSPDLKRIEYLSPAFEKIWGRARDILYQEPELWITYLHPDDLTGYHPIHDMAKKLKKEGALARYHKNYRIIRPDGEIRWIIDQGFPIYNADGQCFGVTGVAVDMTKDKLEEETLRKEKETTEANKAKTEFLRNIEHQLRTPFSGVYTIVQMLADEEQDPTKKELLEMTYMAGIELLELLNDVINISRDETINPVILVKKFDLKLLVEKAVIMEKPAAEVKHLQLTWDYPHDMPNIYIGDSKRIQRILLHLISNAIKFTEQGHIDVEVKLAKKIDSKSHVIQLIVKDTGIGIAKENQNLIYERFYRVSPANHNKYKGAGLGLSVVRQLIDELSGEIEVLSSPGKGSSFICTLQLRCPLLNEL